MPDPRYYLPGNAPRPPRVATCPICDLLQACTGRPLAKPSPCSGSQSCSPTRVPVADAMAMPPSIPMPARGRGARALSRRRSKPCRAVP